MLIVWSRGVSAVNRNTRYVMVPSLQARRAVWYGVISPPKFMFTIQHSCLLFNIHVYYSTFMFTIQHSSLLFEIHVYNFNIQVYYSTFKFTIQHSSLLFNIQVYNLTTFEFLHSSFLFDMQVLHSTFKF